MWADELVVRLAPNVELAGIAPVMDAGQAHTVYQVPGLDGVGYILKAQQYGQNAGALWSALNLMPGEHNHDLKFDCSFSYHPLVQTTPLETIQASFQVALVKTGEVSIWPVPGFDDINFIALQHNARVNIAGKVADADAAQLFPFSPRDTWADVWFYSSTNGAGSGIAEGAWTCNTPTTTHVMLNPANIVEFDGPASVARETEFILTWDCGAYALEGFAYEFHVSGGLSSPDAAQGLLPLVHPSTSGGVAIQVLEDSLHSPMPSGDDAPIEFGTMRVISASPEEARSGRFIYKIPLKARYYQTATDVGNDTIRPGSVHAGLKVMVLYQ